MFDIATATKAQITAELTLMGVEVPRKPNLATLQSLYHAAVAAATPKPLPHTVKPVQTVPGLTIEKDRPTQNGVTRPSAGGRCRAVWDALDAYQRETGEVPTAKVVAALAADEGWNPNNASIEFYQWRKFNGITGRAKRAAAAPVDAS